MSLNSLQKTTISKADIIDQIEGYRMPLQTPYGKLQSLCADLYSSGRSLKVVEQNIDKFVRPFGQSLGKAAREQILNNCYMSILKQLQLSAKVYKCIAFQPRCEMDCFSSICNLYLNQVKEQSQGVKVNVYLQNNQGYTNVLPWLVNTHRIRIITLETDAQGNLKSDSILNTVASHINDSKYHIIQLQSCSSKTNEFLDLTLIPTQIEALRSEYPDQVFHTVLDGTHIISQKEQEEIYSNFDFIIIKSSQIIGGYLAANVLVGRREIVDALSDVDLSKLRLDEDTESIVRMAQILEYSNTIQDVIQSTAENSQLFFDQINSINQSLQATSVLTKIYLGNISTASKTGRYSVLIFQEGGQQFIDDEKKEENGRPVLLAKYLYQFLFDLFGIQTKCNFELKTSNDFYFSDIAPSLIQKYGLTKEEGFSEQNSSTVDIDIHFLLTKDEVLYIAQALKLIAQYGLKIIKYYNNQTLIPKQYIPVEYDISLAACTQFSGSMKDFKFRNELYSEQLQSVTKLFKSTDNYFSLEDGWSEQKSTLFPLNAFEEVLPTKSKSFSSRNSLQSLSQIQVNTQSKNQLGNDEAVKDARSLLLKIQKYGQKNQQQQQQQEVEVVKDSSLVDELQLKIQQLEQSNVQVSEEYIQKLRKEIKGELEKEMNNRLQQERDYQFDISIKVKEKRIRNLRQIFNFYSSLLDVLQEKKEMEKEAQKAKIKSKQEKPVEKPKSIAMNKFFKFCDDFALINEELDIKTLYLIFQKITNTFGEVQFEVFQILLEKMALVFFSKNDQLFTQFDKIEQFYRHIGLDDVKLFKPKLKEEGLVNFSFVFHDKYQLFNQGHVISNKSDYYSNKPALTEENNSTPIRQNLYPSIQNRKNYIDWQENPISMNPKLQYNDVILSQDDVFSEVAYQSNLNSKERNSSLQPKSNTLVKNYKYATPNLKSPLIFALKEGYQNNNNSYISPKVQQSPSSPLNLNKYEYTKPQNNNKSHVSSGYLQKQQSTPKYNNLGKMRGDYDEINQYYDNNYQADHRKQQLMMRAKQIADQEKDKETKRIKTLASQSSPNNVSVKYSPKYDSQNNNQHIKGGEKAYKKDFTNQQSPHSPYSQDQQNLHYFRNSNQQKR